MKNIHTELYGSFFIRFYILYLFYFRAAIKSISVEEQRELNYLRGIKIIYCIKTFE